jgi:hypothetical protein
LKTQTHYFDGAEAKMNRLGLGQLVSEVIQMLQDHHSLVAEQKEANGAAELRDQLDRLFNGGDRKQAKVGDIDWIRCKKINGTGVCVGIEIQVSGRSEMLYKDVLHLRRNIEGGVIDLGIIIVPSDHLQRFLPDRTPSASYAVKVIKEQDADRLPIILLEIGHDGPGPPLKKRKTNLA